MIASLHPILREAIRRTDPAVRPGSPVPLPTALGLFRAFDDAGVVYCQFKSNEHLVEGLAGLTDLDLLVDHWQARAAQAVLMGCGFKRFASLLAGSYPAVEDYLGYDTRAGRLIHIHLHYALVAGESHLKGYQLRLAEALLAGRVVDPATGVCISDPDLEMELLLIRSALKLRWRDGVLELLGVPFVRESVLREHRWLAGRIDPERVWANAAQRLGPEAAAELRSMLADPPTIRGLRRLRSRAMPALADQRTYGRAGALLMRLTREAAWWFSVANRRLFRLPIAARRRNPIGGLVVAFLGPDGCGKTTLAREVRVWLGWKVDVYPAYFGSGDGPVSLLRWPLKAALRLHRRFRFGGSRQPGEGDGRIRALRWVWASALALEKRSRMRACVRARHRGMVVVCDRFPQIQVTGFNDGPLLAAWLDGGPGWRRRIARWESEAYSALCRNVPDLAIKLRVSPEVAIARKPGVQAAEIRRRLEALSRIDYGKRCDHLVIDADRPIEQVLAEVKQAIWERL